jgi:hypothetical protein
MSFWNDTLEAKAREHVWRATSPRARPHARLHISRYHQVRTHIVPGAFARLTRPHTLQLVAKATGG